MKKYWLKDKVEKHMASFKNPSVKIYRDFKNNIVVIDFYGGRCATFTYEGRWIAG